jgi:GAF domain-containing protein
VEKVQRQYLREAWQSALGDAESARAFILAGVDGVVAADPGLVWSPEIAQAVTEGQAVVGASIQSAAEDSASIQSAAEDSASIQSAAEDSASIQSAAEDSASIQSAAEDCASIQSAAEDSASIQSAAEDSASIQSAAEDSASIQSAAGSNGAELHLVALPITLRGQVIGALQLRHKAGRTWQQHEIEVLHAVAEQLGPALESARLFEESQRRAARERLVGEISTRMRETLDVESVLKTAAREIGEALELHDLAIQLEMDTEEQD